MRLLGINLSWFGNKPAEVTKIPTDHVLFNYAPAKEYKTPAYTMEKMTLWNMQEAQLPIALKGTFVDDKGKPTLGNIPRGRIKGNLQLISSDKLERLDKLLGHGVYFTRKMTTLVVPYYDFRGNPIQIHAWMYVGDNSWKDKIEWDHQFYRRGGNNFTLASIGEDPQPWLRRFYHLNGESQKYSSQKTYIYLHRNLSEPTTTEPVKPAVPEVKITVQADRQGTVS